MTDPLVSVVIPVYNVAKVLERCIDSVLASTYANLQIILIDDGSTDMSGTFCDVYAKRDPRIEVIHQSNQGLSAARNVGLAHARGEYLTFVDSDDAISPRFIETLLALCRDHHVDLAVCSALEVPAGDPLPPSDAIHLPPQTLDTAEALTHMLLDDGFGVNAWGKLYARKLWQGIEFPVGKIHEDVGTTYRLFLATSKIVFTPAHLYYYYQNPDSITKQPFTMQKLDLIALTDAMCDEILARANDPATARNLSLVVSQRRMHARFSILRQMVMIDLGTLSPADRTSFRLARREIVSYLRQHSADITKNPFATKRDRLALASLKFGLPVFKFAWKYYDQHRK